MNEKPKISVLNFPFYELVQERTESGTEITVILKEIESLEFQGIYSTLRKTVALLKPEKDPHVTPPRKVSCKKVMLCF